MKNIRIISILALLTFLFSFNTKKESVAAMSELNSESTVNNSEENMSLHNNALAFSEDVFRKERKITSPKVAFYNNEVTPLNAKRFNNNRLKNTRATITIFSPVGGEEYCLFESRYIEWETSGGTVSNVSIFLMHSNGQSIHRTLATNVSNDGRFLWDGAATSPGNYLLKISGLSNATSPTMISGQTGIFTLKDCRKPDLQAGNVQVTPQNPGEGQTVTFKGNVMNYGENPALNPVVTLEIDRPAGLSNKIFREELNVTLEKNNGVTFEKEFNVPKQGTYKTTFTLDPGDLIDEMVENNNVKEWTFGVHGLPDLIVCISNGKRPPVGRKREIRMVVKNIGNTSTDAVSGIKLRSYVEGKGVKVYDIPPLAPGASFTIKRNHKWGKAGTKTITAKVIYSKNEINSNNNEVQGSFFARLPNHDKYSAAPKVKCSTNETFSKWEDFEN